MNTALILHGTNADSGQHWFPWLKGELEKRHWRVWVPDLPQADHPDIERYNEFLLGSDWTFDHGSRIIGHSSGAVAILGLLQRIPKSVMIDTCVLVGAFEGDLGWPELKGMDIDFDFDRIKARARRFVFIHSDNDPYCPLEHAERLSEKLDGELIVRNGQGHFNTGRDPKYTQFPFLLDVLGVDTARDNTIE